MVVSPSDSIVLVEGLDDTTEYTMTLVRDGNVIGKATGTPAEFGVPGALELNHAAAPTFCWDGVTPEMGPGDEVHITDSGGTFEDFATVQDITVTSNPEAAGDNAMTVTGTLGAGLDLANVNVFLRLEVAGADWRADANTVDPANSLVAGPGNTWTATFTQGDTPVDEAVIEAAQNPRVLEATYGVGGDEAADIPFNEATAVGFGAGDPLPEECPAKVSRSIGGLTPSVINVANQGNGLSVSGATATGSSVNVTLEDTDTTVSKAADVTGTSWSADFAAAELTDLDGTITVIAEHAPDNGVPAANTRTLLKDIEAPGSPTPFPEGGSFVNSTFITLSAGPGETIRYTLGNGTQPAPTASSGTVYNGPILVSQTAVLKAVAVDAAGNVSPPLTRTFTRLVPPAPTAPGGGGTTTPLPGSGAAPGTGAGAVIPLAPAIADAKSGKPGGADTATARWRAPVANGAVRDGYAVRALKLRPGKSAKIRPAVVVGPNATKLKLTLPAGKYRFQVRATSAAGDSPWSERSNKVTSR